MHRAAVRIIGLLVPLFVTSWTLAETTVTLEKTHLCCGSCVTGAEKAVGKVEGAKAVCDRGTKTITITAPDDATAQKALDALVDAGFYGKATGATIKEDAAAPSGNVQSLTLSEIHNCCGRCTSAINKTIKSVPGATGEIKNKEQTVTVTGDFDASKLVQALNEAGFHCKAAAR